MKRSKMVLLISEMLVDQKYIDVMYQASYMLRKLEEKGMKPPLLYPGTQTEPEDIYEWEPESRIERVIQVAEPIPMQTIDPKTFEDNGYPSVKHCTCKGFYQPVSCPIHGSN